MFVGWGRKACGVVLCVMTMAATASAATLRQGFTETTVAAGLAGPTAMAFAPDGRLFVAQQGGAVRVIKDGTLLPAPFVTVTVNAVGERGLLGIAFDPQFTSNQFVYIYYTATTPTIHNRVSRFTAIGDTAVPGSEFVLMDLPTLNATNHNGGAIHFGPDGFLYVAVGENAVRANAPSLNSPLGKILRIAKDGTIPSSNPFAGQTTGLSRAIWALGLRNPFTFTFSPDGASPVMLINDVGEGTWEEVNVGQEGANYGWPDTEGPTTDPRFIAPLYAYTQAATGGCAITGAARYPLLAPQFPPEYGGDYFFADLCAGWIRQYDFATGIGTTNFASGISAPVDLAVGPDGALYFLARGSGATTGTVGRIDHAGAGASQPPVPTITAPASTALYVVGGTIAYAGSATDPEDGTLSASRFTWDVFFHHGDESQLVLGPISGVTSGSFVVPDSGETATDVWYRVRLTVTDSAGRSASTFVDVRPRTGTNHAAVESRRIDTHARWAAGDVGGVVHECRRDAAHHRCTVFTNAGRRQLPTQVVVRSRRADARHRDAGAEHDLHGVLPQAASFERRCHERRRDTAQVSRVPVTIRCSRT